MAHHLAHANPCMKYTSQDVQNKPIRLCGLAITPDVLNKPIRLCGLAITPDVLNKLIRLCGLAITPDVLNKPIRLCGLAITPDVLNKLIRLCGLAITPDVLNKLIRLCGLAITPDVLNKPIRLCGLAIRDPLVKACNTSLFYEGFIADEARDVATIEQIAICTRYLGRNDATFRLKITEEFLGFVEAEKTTLSPLDILPALLS